ncbi:MAG TPA: FAD-dependent thymidylate synthase [Candidatus Onthomonas avicola]|nr:FAD-dependent thymidylate synthase [Candidatus Onthomonas avicola]
MLHVQLIAHTPEPERVVAAAAKLCYSDTGVETLLEGLTPEKSAKFVKMLASYGHASPIEHASFTFGIEGVSRALLAQITRHRIASFSVQSQRYVRLDDFRFVIPPEVEADPASKAAFLAAMKEEGRQYLQLAQTLQAKHKAEFLAQGLPEGEAERKAEKLANEDARFVLPNACETKMVVTMNARSLQNFFRLRCCNRAQWEIRALAEEMFKLVYPIAPALFDRSGPPCVAGACTEGKMTCGRAEEVHARYTRLRAELEGRQA